MINTSFRESCIKLCCFVFVIAHWFAYGHQVIGHCPEMHIESSIEGSQLNDAQLHISAQKHILECPFCRFFSNPGEFAESLQIKERVTTFTTNVISSIQKGFLKVIAQIIVDNVPPSEE